MFRSSRSHGNPGDSPTPSAPVIGFFLGFPDKLSKLAGRSSTVKKLNSSKNAKGDQEKVGLRNELHYISDPILSGCSPVGFPRFRQVLR